MARKTSSSSMRGQRGTGNEYYTAGGRVLGVTALGDTYADAIDKAYEAVSCIDFEGMHFRKDIGKKAFGRSNGSASQKKLVR